MSASGYVSGLIETGGKCTFEFAGDGRVVRVASEGIADRMTTSCGVISAPVSDFAVGLWTVTLKYELDTVSTMSQPMNVEIS
ncbi:hypothetical protein BJ997_002703 [Cryobacterium roopkundense]|uniref:Uncharacterized protein n=1 Tax=Cryobacterium roopkundense TaxID=1001240 RepID=A0A7W8ZYA1_9MICO|nr:hypothetical protein [Cryobacterium roopkundense]